MYSSSPNAQPARITARYFIAVQYKGNHLYGELAEFMNGALVMKQSSPFPHTDDDFLVDTYLKYIS